MRDGLKTYAYCSSLRPTLPGHNTRPAIQIAPRDWTSGGHDLSLSRICLVLFQDDGELGDDGTDQRWEGFLIQGVSSVGSRRGVGNLGDLDKAVKSQLDIPDRSNIGQQQVMSRPDK